MASIMRLVSAELDDLLSVLREIPDADWDRPTACDGFRVRDVAAHLALVILPLNRRLARGLLNPPARMARLAGEWSVERADTHTPAELMDTLGQRVADPRRGFLGRIDPAQNMLADHATHTQDVRVGLGRRTAPEPERGRAVLDAAVRLRLPITWGTRERARGLRLVATDLDWTHGSGPELVGPYDALLLALSGRSAGLAHLSGDGLAVIADMMPTKVPA